MKELATLSDEKKGELANGPGLEDFIAGSTNEDDSRLKRKKGQRLNIFNFISNTSQLNINKSFYFW